MLAKYDRAEKKNGQEGRCQKSIPRMPGPLLPLCAGRILNKIACFPTAKMWHFLHFSFSDMGFCLLASVLGAFNNA